MEKSIFKFIWKYSYKEQLGLLLVTVLTFPILYVSLELPKRIINDAIGGTGEPVLVLGFSLSQIQFLFLLCVGFLIAVFVNGLLKMRLNTMKGVLAERLLRRFRYQLLTRILRFPKPYFRTTSQGELVSMVTSEAEPMGGIMGDMVSQPIFQAGQMLTILAFLFAQSVLFGLAAIALIPLQAWIIPKLQRQINQLNKGRIQAVRQLSSDIGESAAGVSDIRTNGGLRYRMSLFSDRLGTLYDIRFEIYQKKYFMKFLNNFINQLTPFFFYLVGGYLAITGHITVGALVAALAAFKDMSSPWKELLAYYNATQDVAVRWETVIERFTPGTLVDSKLFEGMPEDKASLRGDIEIIDVTVSDEEGRVVLEDINLTIPQGARVGIKASNEVTAQALADILTRELIPQRGIIKIAGQELNTLHQVTLANNIGYAHSNPHILEGTLGDNLLLPFKSKPYQTSADQSGLDQFIEQAKRSGNSVDPFDVNWVDPGVAGLQSSDQIRDWWFELVQVMGIDDFMVRRALHSLIDTGKQKRLAEEIVRLRPEIEKRLVNAGVDDIVHRFDPDRFNPVSPLGSNLLYALPTRLLTQVSLSENKKFVTLLRDKGLADELMEMSVTLVETLRATFGDDGTEHPLFRRLNMEEELYNRLGAIINRRRSVGDAQLPAEDYSLMLTVPFAFSAEQIGPAFSVDFKQRVLQIRKSDAEQMVQAMGGMFRTIDPSEYISVMTVMSNALFGRVSALAGAREKLVEDAVVDVINDFGLQRLVAESIYDLATSSGGRNLPAVFRERIAFSRASIKKPDILILQNSLASHDSGTREKMRVGISQLMPETTKIFIESNFENAENYDLYVEVTGGRIDSANTGKQPLDVDSRKDLDLKIDGIASAELFKGLERKQQRLLAFSAQWFVAKPGQKIFSVNEEADAAYLAIEGRAALYWTLNDGKRTRVSEVLPGRLIGDLSIITKERRQLDLEAVEDSVFLRIGATELMAVIENDAMVASNLMKSVAGNLNTVIERTRSLRTYSMEHGVDFSEFDAL